MGKRFWQNMTMVHEVKHLQRHYPWVQCDSLKWRENGEHCEHILISTYRGLFSFHDMSKRNIQNFKSMK